MKIDYVNMPHGASKLNFALRYLFNVARTFFIFHFKYPWIEYKGFVRVMKGVKFAKKTIKLGNNVQFGIGCYIETNTVIGNYVLLAGKVSFIEKYGHTFSEPCVTIWNSRFGIEEPVVIEDDVWIGDGVLVFSGCRIGKGSVVSARSVVTKDIPPCEIWGGIPAKKIKDRFETELQKETHIQYLSTLSND